MLGAELRLARQGRRGVLHRRADGHARSRFTATSSERDAELARLRECLDD